MEPSAPPQPFQRHRELRIVRAGKVGRCSQLRRGRLVGRVKVARTCPLDAVGALTPP